MAPRASVPLREIVYTLSPYNQEIVMQGVQKLPGKIAKFFANVSARVSVQIVERPWELPNGPALHSTNPVSCATAAELLGPCHLQHSAVCPYYVSIRGTDGLRGTGSLRGPHNIRGTDSQACWLGLDVGELPNSATSGVAVSDNPAVLPLLACRQCLQVCQRIHRAGKN